MLGVGWMWSTENHGPRFHAILYSSPRYAYNLEWTVAAFTQIHSQRYYQKVIRAATDLM